MDPLQLWAGVRFAAQNGNTGGLLTAAAQNGLHLSAITAQPGGFCARCAAWRYPELSRLARRYRVRLRVQKRDGLFFRLRPLLRRRGLWAGLFLFLPLLLWLQGAVWATDFTTLTPGQRARAEVILRQQALSAGEFVSEEKLTAGEYALLQSGEFSWASLNFSKGRLIVEAAAAQGFEGSLLGSDTLDSNKVLEAAAGSDVQLYVSTFYQEGGSPEFDDGIKAWLNEDSTAMTNNGGNDTIAAVTAMGYDAYYVALEALKAAGSTDAGAVKAALPGVTYTGVTGVIAFDDIGDAIRDTAYIKVADTANSAWALETMQKAG